MMRRGCRAAAQVQRAHRLVVQGESAAASRLSLAGAGKVLRFGKHAGKTYEAVFEAEPQSELSLCTNILEQYVYYIIAVPTILLLCFVFESHKGNSIVGVWNC